MTALVILSVLSLAALANSAAIDDDIHVTVRATDSAGNATPGTYVFQFKITTDSACTNVVYTDTATLTTDSQGIVDHYLENVSLEWDEQYYVCYYRDSQLKSARKISRSPYAFTAANASQVAWTGVTSRPTALSSFTDDIDAKTTYNTTYASYISLNSTNFSSFSNTCNLLDGYDSSYFAAAGYLEDNYVNKHGDMMNDTLIINKSNGDWSTPLFQLINYQNDTVSFFGTGILFQDHDGTNYNSFTATGLTTNRETLAVSTSSTGRTYTEGVFQSKVFTNLCGSLSNGLIYQFGTTSCTGEVGAVDNVGLYWDRTKQEINISFTSTDDHLPFNPKFGGQFNGVVTGNGSFYQVNVSELCDENSSSCFSLSDFGNASTGYCSAGQIVQNITTGGVECVEQSAGNVSWNQSFADDRYQYKENQRLSTYDNVTFNSASFGTTRETTSIVNVGGTKGTGVTNGLIVNPTLPNTNSGLYGASFSPFFSGTATAARNIYGLSFTTNLQNGDGGYKQTLYGGYYFAGIQALPTKTFSANDILVGVLGGGQTQSFGGTISGNITIIGGLFADNSVSGGTGSKKVSVAMGGDSIVATGKKLYYEGAVGSANDPSFTYGDSYILWNSTTSSLEAWDDGVKTVRFDNGTVVTEGNLNVTSNLTIQNKPGKTTSASIVTSVDFLGSVTTSCTMNFTSGVLTTDSTC